MIHTVGKKIALGVILIVALLTLLAPLSLTTSNPLGVEVHTAHANLADSAVNNIGIIMVNVASAFTWIGGSLLDYVVDGYVIKMGELVRSQGFGTAIETGWTVIRDISNIIFIFGFVYIGIRTIIEGAGANTQRFLTTLIIAALLINFSLFFTRVIIDVSNVFTTEIYELMVPDDRSQWNGIAAGFMQQMGLINIYSPDADIPALWTSGSFTFWLGASIFLLVAGLVFAAGGILLIIRFAMLMLFMTFSPILFSMSVFPQTAPMASRLWRNIFSYAFFAPIYFFFIYVSFLLVKNASGATGVSGIQNALTGGGTFETIALFFLIIVFLVISLIAATQLGIAGGSAAVGTLRGAGNQARTLAGNATIGGAARFGRQTFGKYGLGLSENKDLQERARKGGIGGIRARMNLRAANAMATASYDPRRVADTGKKLGIGEGKKGGYKAMVEEAEKKEKAFVKQLGEVGDDDPRVMQLQSELDIAERVLDRAKSDDEKAAAKRNVQIARQKLEQEKNRRVLGSIDDKPQEVIDAHENARRELAKLQDQFAIAQIGTNGVSDTVKMDTLRPQVEAARVAYTKAKKEYEASAGGYAAVVGNKGFWKSLFTSRNKDINKRAGKALEKELMKKTKKDKDDIRTDAIVEAAKSKSDD